MRTHFSSSSPLFWSRVRRAVLVLTCLLAIAIPSEAAAQSAAVRYQRAMAREKAARASSKTTLKALRSIAAAYEALVRAYPRSGYSDNALWQGAGMYALAYEKGHLTRDRSQATRLLKW